MTSRRTRRSGASAVLTVLAVAGLSACGGGGSSKPPTNLSLSGAKLPVSTLTTGLKSLCTVVSDAQSSPANAKTTYFGSAYNPLHQLAAVLHGSQSDDLLRAMEAFERSVLATPPGSDAAAKAQTLQSLVTTDLRSLKVTPPKC